MFPTETAFYLLGASTLDNKNRIREIADERAILEDEQSMRDAQRALCTPNKRVEHEIAWFPGIHQDSIAKLIERAKRGLVSSHISGCDFPSQLHPLAYCNLLTLALNYYNTADIPVNEETASYLLLALAESSEKLHENQIRSIINADRLRANFPETNDVSSALQRQQSFYVSVLHNFLTKLNQDIALPILTETIEKTTSMGERQNFYLLDELVSMYEVHHTENLEALEEEIKKGIQQIKNYSPEKLDKNSFSESIKQLLELVRRWDRIAQPIQVSLKSKGIEDKRSRDICMLLRELAVHIFNKYDDADSARTIVEVLRDLFKEVPSVEDLLQDDEDFLRNKAPKLKRSIGVIPFYDKYKSVPKNLVGVTQQTKLILQTIDNKFDNPKELTDNARDMIAMLLTRYAVKLANVFCHFRDAESLLKKALEYVANPDLKKLGTVNIERTRRNNNIFNSEQLNFRKKCKQTIIWLFFLIMLGLALVSLICYVNSDNYHWRYDLQDENFVVRVLSNLNLDEEARTEAMNSLKLHFSRHMQGLSRDYTVKEFQDKFDHYLHLPEDILTTIGAEESVYEAVCREQSREAFNFYYELFPNGAHSGELRELTKHRSMELWRKNASPCTVAYVDDFLSKHQEVKIADIEKDIINYLQGINGSTNLKELTAWEKGGQQSTDAIRAAAKQRIGQIAQTAWNKLPRPLRYNDVLQFFHDYPTVDKTQIEEKILVELREMKQISDHDAMCWEKIITLPDKIREIEALNKDRAQKAWNDLHKPYLIPEVMAVLQAYPSLLNTAIESELAEQIKSESAKGKDITGWANIGRMHHGVLSETLHTLLKEASMKTWERIPSPYTPEIVQTFLKNNPEVETTDIDSDVLADLKKRYSKLKPSNQDLDSWGKIFPFGIIKAYVIERREAMYDDFSYVEKLGTTSAYQRYLNRNPKGKYAQLAKKRLVDMEVDSIQAHNHADYTPSFNENSRQGTAYLSITNGTEYTISVLYSGKKSVKQTLRPHQSTDITLPSGNYRIAVTTTQKNIIPFYGEHHIGAGRYEERFYIRSTTPPFPQDYYSLPLKFRSH